MTDSGSGQGHDPHSSSGDHGAPTGSGPSGAPDFFSREGAGSGDGYGSPDPTASSAPTASSSGSAAEWPNYPAGGPSSASQPSASQPSASDPYPGAYPTSYGGQQPSYPAYDQSAIPPYGDQGGSAQGQGGYAPPPGSYGSNPYDQQVNPYQAQPYGAYGYVPQQHPQAVLALVLGLVGLVVCPPVGIAGLVIGNRVRKEVDANPAQYAGRAMGTAGFVLGILSIVYLVVIVIYFVVVVGMMAAYSG